MQTVIQPLKSNLDFPSLPSHVHQRVYTKFVFRQVTRTKKKLLFCVR